MTDHHPEPRSAPRGLPWLRFLIVGLLIAADLWTKHAVFAWLTPVAGQAPSEGVEVWITGRLRYEVLGDFLGFMLSLNKGAAWGFGDSMPHLLVGGRVVASIVLAVLLWRADRRHPWTLAALALILSGALGNLHDNLLQPAAPDHPYGAVRDFIHVYFYWWKYHFPTFNVADSCITVGAVILIVGGLFSRAEEPAVAGAATEPGTDAA
ncbi:signal peptidase II [Engelhardtia mirabilis]|uniref:Lipoprotein signal peptidase n=1 Tax=Engelhardtia mirabilis TaxID=2528011 RepID=A0A518BLS0_9BACT|nr:Lipoprotein signal peptidase [Planctomycetes bacterium Pla133]QDV02238.1 Lipoprotein signal peptidase [Planctomycetes bacterium Pla86]